MERPPQIETLVCCFEDVPDPRAERGVRHLMVDILTTALIAMVSGADNGEAINEFCRANERWLRTLLSLPHGIPSQDVYLRVFAAMDRDAFQAAFRHWVEQLEATRDGGHVAIDGKTLRGSFDKGSGSKAIHVVSAWLSEGGLVLGQLKTEEKSNEITAIPDLLRLIDVRGATVTIDAMGCQRAIAENLVASGANYVLAVKDNQPALHDNIAGFFADAQRPERPLHDPAPVVDRALHVDAGHGRIEERLCLVSRDLSWVNNADAWSGLNAIAMVKATQQNTMSGKTSTETRYYIVSHAEITAERLNRTVRDHWGIENSLHWVLDVTFGEDGSRIRTGNAAANFAVLRHTALNLLRNAPGKKRSMRLRRMRCAWDHDYLLKVLGLQAIV